MRRMLVLTLLLFLLLTLIMAGCGGEESEEPEPTPGDTRMEEEAGEEMEDEAGDEGAAFTLDSLAEFDGKDGRPAYVAVDGVVYDVTGSSTWPEGDHTPCDLEAMAGRDLSEVIKQAPARMRELLEQMPVVGTI